LIGDIQSEGESIPTLRKNITEQLSRYIKNPRVSVIIDRFGGKRVVLIDETGGGKVIRFTAPIPILEVLAMGPGYNYDANLKKIFIIREPKESGGKVQLIVCNAQEVLRHGDIRENVYVKSGDTIFLARGMLASVANFIKQINRITNLKYNYTWHGKAMEAVVDTNFDQSQDTKTISDPY
jgi:polysaccharide export outer membrane protein